MSGIAEYSETEAALAILREQYGRSYDVTTPSGMKEAKEARAKVKGYRVALEKLRVEIKAPALDRCRLIDEEAKRITKELLAIEDPIDAQIHAEEERKAAEKARAEAEKKARAEAARADCELMRVMLTKAAGETAARIAEAIEIVRAVPVPDNEHGQEVASTRDGTVEAMAKFHAAAVAREAEEARLAAERAELERQKAEADRVAREAAARLEAEAKAERDRIAAEQKAADEAAAAERRRIEAEQQAARERILAEERAADERRREADAKAAAERDRLAAEAKRQRDEEEAKLRAEREKLDEERRAAEAKARAEREAREAAERAAREAEEEKQRAIEAERRRRLDARTMLGEFVRLYGDLPEHAVIAEDIRDHLAHLDSAHGEAA